MALITIQSIKGKKSFNVSDKDAERLSEIAYRLDCLNDFETNERED